MQKKVEFIAKNTEEAMAEAVKRLHISSDKIFVNVLGELPEGLNCEALVDVNLTLEGKKYLERILKALNIGYQIEARSVGGEQQIHYIVDSYENSLLIGVKGKTLEAMHNSIPIVSTSVGIEGMPGIENYICPKDDATSFASEVVKILKNHNYASELGFSYSTYVSKYYSVKLLKNIFS